MENQATKNGAETLRFLPSIDALLRSNAAAGIVNETGAKHLTVLARLVIDEMRREMQESCAYAEKNEKDFSRENLLAEAEKNLEKLWQSERDKSLRRVVNATGVVIHTNLGRAPLSENARKAIFEKAGGYCNLEYNLETGKRGKRGERAESLLAEITGAESALVVNNCAAACILVLTALAKGGEAVISRGELVEIGGDFRIPDVMTESGAILREVGATNRTRVSDYEKAINENTRLIVKVHPSNYRIIGFTSTPNVTELAGLAERNDVLLYEDAGSGALFDLSEYGLTDEPIVSQSIAAGADIVTFSGDKLLGGVQSGLIVGQRETIEKLRKHPLYRALRVDKLIYAALEATLESFCKEKASEEIPVLKMLAQTADELKKRAENFVCKLKKTLSENSGLRVEITQGNSVIGGGSAPAVQPPTTLLALKHERMPVAKLEEFLRFSRPPVIARIVEDKVLIDLRTVSEIEETELLEILAKME
ncbi:MAG TPA: L-seryl-tRNA(Sec) selenium transferase [Pyrinomonadaceae bacterium]|nr:L-seryl-tRNA(Sec) selenium transferase [Pyrinomonadaceae bacterium]